MCTVVGERDEQDPQPNLGMARARRTFSTINIFKNSLKFTLNHILQPVKDRCMKEQRMY